MVSGFADNMQQDILFTAVGDTSCSEDTKKTFKSMVNRNPHINLFLGDSSYQLDAMCFIYMFNSFAGLKEKTILQGEIMMTKKVKVTQLKHNWKVISV